MNKDAIWGVLVLILVASLAAAVIERDDAGGDQEPPVEQNEIEDQTSVNQTDPVHDDGHLHAAPILSLISAEDDGATISMYGFVIHAHPNETLVNVVFENESIATIQQIDFCNCELFTVPPKPSSTKIQTYAFDFVT